MTGGSSPLSIFSPTPPDLNDALVKAQAALELARTVVAEREEAVKARENERPRTRATKKAVVDDAKKQLEDAKMDFHRALDDFNTLNATAVSSSDLVARLKDIASPEGEQTEGSSEVAKELTQGTAGEDKDIEMEKAADDFMDQEEDLVNALALVKQEEVPHKIPSIPSTIRTKEVDGTIEILDSSDEMDIDDKPAIKISKPETAGKTKAKGSSTTKSAKKGKTSSLKTEEPAHLDENVAMVLDDGFLESKLKKPKKKTIGSLEAEETGLQTRIDAMSSCVDDSSLPDGVKEGITLALTIATERMAFIQKDLVKMRAKNKAGKGKEKQTIEAGDTSDGPTSGTSRQPAIEVRWEESMDDEEKETHREEALLDFMFYKAARASSQHKQLEKQVEDLKGNPIHSRHRAFLSQVFIAATGIHIDNLYVGEEVEFGGETHLLGLVNQVLGKINRARTIADKSSPMVVLAEAVAKANQGDGE
ncbi:hypothetical protein DFH06DRAFT_1342244 [Mycena polygramma]|nr:hypothetical protein DFH06DRAFT_1342244 [Mycena polygramma]